MCSVASGGVVRCAPLLLQYRVYVRKRVSVPKITYIHLVHHNSEIPTHPRVDRTPRESTFPPKSKSPPSFVAFLKPCDRGMFGALHVLREEPTYATALTETDGVAYTLVSQAVFVAQTAM